MSRFSPPLQLTVADSPPEPLALSAVFDWSLMDGGSVSQLSTVSNNPGTTFRPLTFLYSALPSLRHRLSSGIIAIPRPPLLTLAFSSISFLDATVYDQRSREPLYVFSTSGAVTTVSRCRALDSESTVKAADIRWPLIPPAKNNNKHLQWVLVQIGLCLWKSGCDVLRASRNDW
jgi:hypothetical protein